MIFTVEKFGEFGSDLVLIPGVKGDFSFVVGYERPDAIPLHLVEIIITFRDFVAVLRQLIVAEEKEPG